MPGPRQTDSTGASPCLGGAQVCEPERGYRCPAHQPVQMTEPVQMTFDEVCEMERFENGRSQS